MTLAVASCKSRRSETLCLWLFPKLAFYFCSCITLFTGTSPAHPSVTLLCSVIALITQIILFACLFFLCLPSLGPKLQERRAYLCCLPACLLPVNMSMLVTQSCLTLCSPMDCSPPGSSVHGILEARILKWVVMPFSGDLPDPGVKRWSLTLQADSSTSESPRKTLLILGWVWTQKTAE